MEKNLPIVLLVVATRLEGMALIKAWEMKPLSERLYEVRLGTKRIHLLCTGIGIVNTSFRLGIYLANYTPELAINFGIAGTVVRSYTLGQVVEVVEDTFVEMGAEDGEAFLDMQDLGFAVLKTKEASYYNTFGGIVYPSFPNIPQVRGGTVNLVRGNEVSITYWLSKWNTIQIETMEGAAFFHAMLASGIPFRAFRALSNYVERRDKRKWKLKMAVDNIQVFMQNWMETYCIGG